MARWDAPLDRLHLRHARRNMGTRYGAHRGRATDGLTATGRGPASFESRQCGREWPPTIAATLGADDLASRHATSTRTAATGDTAPSPEPGSSQIATLISRPFS